MSAVYRDNREVADLIRRVERETPILDIRIGRWMAWAAVRFQVHVDAMNFTQAQAGRSRNRFQRLRGGLETLLTAARPLPRGIPGGRSWVIQHASSLMEVDRDGRTRDIHWDAAIEADPSCVRLMMVDNPRFRARVGQARHAPHAETGPIDATIALRARLLRGERRVRDAAARIDACLASAGLVDHGGQQLATGLARFLAERAVWGSLIARFGIDRLLITNWCGCPGAVAAAREAGCEVVEMQHGLIDADHPGFSWGSAAKGHREAMPVPDRLLLFGEYFSGLLAAPGFWGRELEVVGSARIDRYRRMRPAAVPRDLLVTLQPLPLEPVLAFLERAIAAAGPGWRWRIKLHPTHRDASPVVARLGGLPGVEILSAEVPPGTMEALAAAYAHLSISSTCHYEAIALGVPTVVLPVDGHEHVVDLVERGWAFQPRDAAHLAGVLADGGLPDPPAGASAALYAMGASTAMRDALARRSQAASTSR